MTLADWMFLAFWVVVPVLAFWTGYEIGRDRP